MTKELFENANAIEAKRLAKETRLSIVKSLIRNIEDENYERIELKMCSGIYPNFSFYPTRKEFEIMLTMMKDRLKSEIAEIDKEFEEL